MEGICIIELQVNLRNMKRRLGNKSVGCKRSKVEIFGPSEPALSQEGNYPQPHISRIISDWDYSGPGVMSIHT